MNIYVDYDDCLCETARFFSMLLKDLYKKSVPYDRIQFFNLKQSFSLTEEEYERIMKIGHEPQNLLSYEATPGAKETINAWADAGHEVFIITGRPFSCFDASREWLDRNGFERVKLYCLNKYGRDNFIKNSDFNLELEDYYKIHFDYAVEDSPEAFRFLTHLPDLKVLVYDRPWNREGVFPNENFRRCTDWATIRNLVK